MGTDAYTTFIDKHIGNILFVASMLFCGLVVCGIIAIPLYLSNRQRKQKIQLKETGKSTQGKVVNTYIKSKGNRNTGIHYRTEYVNYIFTADNGQMYANSFIQDKKNPYKKDDLVDVYYDPDNPEKHCTQRDIDESSKGKLLFVILFAVIILTIILTLFFFFGG